MSSMSGPNIHDLNVVCQYHEALFTI